MPVSPFKKKFGRNKQSVKDPDVERTRERLLALRSVPAPYQETDSSNLWDDKPNINRPVPRTHNPYRNRDKKGRVPPD